MNKKLTILVDCDNVLNNLCTAVLSVYNKDYNDDLKVRDITSYHIENFVKPEAKEKFYEYFTNKEVWKKIKPDPAAKEVINELRAAGHRVMLCTATEPANAMKKSAWCCREYGFDPRKDFIMINDKKMVKADILIDDYYKNFGGQQYSIALRKPWNKKEDLMDYFRARKENELYICKTWEDIRIAIDLICNGGCNYDIEKVEC